MKCGVFVLRTDKGTPLRFWEGEKHGVPDDRAIPCEGLVHLNLSLLEEPFWGGISTRLDMDFVCDTCGWIRKPYYSSDDLEKFVNRILDKEDDITFNDDS